jgi:hypothetical protein
MARRKLIPGRVQLWGYEIQIDWAIPEHDVDEETMSKVNHWLFVSCFIPFSIYKTSITIQALVPTVYIHYKL